jgi:CheY-like chemotaxis protein/HPt (histidine-containing phosphotransfer) domain-containing protein
LAIRFLEKMGHHVVLAVNGKEAVEQAQRRLFDLVLMDIQMPIMGGVQATQFIRTAEINTGRRVPIVAMTAHALKGDREKYLAAGMDGYVSKPIRTDLLRSEIARAMKITRNRAQLNEVPAVKQKDARSLDREELLNRVEHDEELAREILEIFQKDCAANRGLLRAAVEACRLDEVRHHAHAFKGMLANLAAGPAMAAAGQLETLAGEQNTKAIAGAWQAFDQELSGVLLEVEHLLAGTLQ